MDIFRTIDFLKPVMEHFIDGKQHSCSELIRYAEEKNLPLPMTAQEIGYFFREYKHTILEHCGIRIVTIRTKKWNGANRYKFVKK